MSYIINQSSLEDYEAKNGKLTYGFAASANNNMPLDENGDVKDNVVKVELSKCESKYSAVDFVLTADDWTEKNAASAKFSFNMYVIVNNAVKYITANGYSDTAEAYTYSDVA